MIFRGMECIFNFLVNAERISRDKIFYIQTDYIEYAVNINIEFVIFLYSSIS